MIAFDDIRELEVQLALDRPDRYGSDVRKAVTRITADLGRIQKGGMRETAIVEFDSINKSILEQILDDPAKRREMMACVIVTIQARDGITTTSEKAEKAYELVQREIAEGKS